MKRLAAIFKRCVKLLENRHVGMCEIHFNNGGIPAAYKVTKTKENGVETIVREKLI